MAKNLLDKYNKRIKRSGELKDFVTEKLRDENLTLTKSGFLSMDNIKNRSEEETQELLTKLDNVLLPKNSADLTYKYSYDLFTEILLDYYEFDTEDGVVMDSNTGRTGQLNPKVTKLSREQQNELTRLLRGDLDAETGKWSGGLGSAFRNKSKGYDARTVEALQRFRGYFGRRT